MDLNDLMQFDHVVLVREDGSVTDKGIEGVYAPEITCDYSGPFAEAQVSKAHEADMIEHAKAQGWTLETGWTGQYSYSGAIMHASEFIGGLLADHICETPGYWVACTVELHPGEDDPEYRDGNGESEYAGWIVAHRETV
jgi:hypothetical protein